MDEATGNKHEIRSVKRGRPPKAALLEPVVDSRAQTHALKIWSGQSPDLPVKERVQRIIAGLKEQGLDLNITLPHPDAERYL